MGEAIGAVLPLALGVAVSPVPIIAVVLMLLSSHAGLASVAFAVGWVVALTVVVLVVTVLVDPVGDTGSGTPSTFASWAKIVLGAVALLLSVQQWRSRPRPGQEAALPGWMAAMDSVGPLKATGLGALLAAGNPKNLTLSLSAGVSIGAAGASAGGTAAAIAVFVVLGSVTVVGPVVAFLVARQRVSRGLDELRGWLTHNSAIVMSVLLLVLGATLVGQGVAGF